MTYLVKRPVAFRVPRIIDDKLSDSEWQLFGDEGAANAEAEAKGCDYHALFVRDGTAIVAEWELIGSAPTEGQFLICAPGERPFVVSGRILWASRKGNTPSHLGLSHITHWMPLPASPRITGAVGNAGT